MSHPVWHWEIAVYLFLGGLTAGLMILGAAAGGHDRSSRAMRFLPFLAPLVLSAGMFALFLDLGSKTNLFRFYTTFQVLSPMSWGAWILVAVYPASIALGLARIGVLRVDLRRLEVANVVLGIALGAYTGILLASLSARVLWSTRLLAPLFLVSGISTAAALAMLLPVTAEEHGRIRRWDVLAIAAELTLLALYLTEPAAAVFRGGSYTAAFWAFVVFGGLAIPLTLELIECRRRIHATVAAPALILAGGFALRWILVAAGQAA